MDADTICTEETVEPIDITINSFEEVSTIENGDVQSQTNYDSSDGTSRIFSMDEEDLLAKYLRACLKMNVRLTKKFVCQLAYDMAIRNAIDIEDEWKMTKLADRSWLHGFRERYPDLKIKDKLSKILTSDSARNLPFKIFYKKLNELYQNCSVFANGSRVYCLDETSLSSRVRGKSTDNIKMGDLITVCCIINAHGCLVPPAVVFPTSYYNPKMVEKAPPGTLGLANPSGWMTPALFIQVMQHFITLTNSSKTNQSLLIFDSHDFHLSIEILDLAEEHGVSVLTFSPHFSHKLQPLDVSVYTLFRTNFYKTLDREFRQSYDCTYLGSAVSVACLNSLRPGHIKEGFQKTGVFPFSADLYKLSAEKSIIMPNPSRVVISLSTGSKEPEISKTNLLRSFEEEIVLENSQIVIQDEELIEAENIKFSSKSKQKETIINVEEGKESTSSESPASDLMVAYSLTSEGKYRCDECNYETVHKRGIKRHSLTHKKPKLFKCPHCDHCTSRKHYLQIHLMTHKSEKRFKCIHCPYTSNFSSYFRQHLLNHAGTYLFNCSLCDYKTNSKSGFQSHTQTHSNTKQFSCSDCGQTFKHRYAFRKHEVKIHQKFKCPKCESAVYTKEEFRAHLLSHSDINVYECPDCFYATPSNYRYKIHVAKHTKPRKPRIRRKKFPLTRTHKLV